MVKVLVFVEGFFWSTQRFFGDWFGWSVFFFYTFFLLFFLVFISFIFLGGTKNVNIRPLCD